MTPEMNHLKTYNINIASYIGAVSDTNEMFREGKLKNPVSFIRTLCDVPVDDNVGNYNNEEQRLIAAYIVQNVVRLKDGYDRETAYATAVSDMEELKIKHPFNMRHCEQPVTTGMNDEEIVDTVKKPVEPGKRGRKATTMGVDGVAELYKEMVVNGTMTAKDLVDHLVASHGMKQSTANVYVSKAKKV